MLCDTALWTNVEAHGVPTRIARAEWSNLAVTAFAHELAGTEQRLEMVGPLLLGKIRSGRADVKGDVRKDTPGQCRWVSPLQSPTHGLRSASGHVDFGNTVGIPR